MRDHRDERTRARVTTIAFLSAMILGCGQRGETGSSTKTAEAPSKSSSAVTPVVDESNLGEYVDFPGCGIKLRRPQGFNKADTYSGFVDMARQASVMASRLSSPYSKNKSSLDPDNMRESGWTFRSSESVTVDGLPGVLAHFDQPAGEQVVEKWALVVGDATKTIIVTASFPKEHSAELSARTRSSVLSARIDQAVRAGTAGFSFAIAESKKLKRVDAINRALVYSPSGKFPISSPGEPRLIVVESLSQAPFSSHKEFAEHELRATATIEAISVESEGPIKVADLAAYETIATATHTDSRTPLVVYQVVLTSKSSHFRIFGLMGADRRDEFLPEFRSLARSLEIRGP